MKEKPSENEGSGQMVVEEKQRQGRRAHVGETHTVNWENGIACLVVQLMSFCREKE